MKALDETLIQCRECFVPDVLSDILEFEYVPSKKLAEGSNKPLMHVVILCLVRVDLPRKCPFSYVLHNCDSYLFCLFDNVSCMLCSKINVPTKMSLFVSFVIDKSQQENLEYYSSFVIDKSQQENLEYYLSFVIHH